MLNPDALLRDYAEALTLLGSARAQRLTLTFGEIQARKCLRTANCTGHPHQEAEGWKCSLCHKPWSTEAAELGVNEEGRRTGGTQWHPSQLYERLIDFGRILDTVEQELPWAFIAWSLYVLSPGPYAEAIFSDSAIPARRTPTLGIHQDQVAQLLLDLEQRGILRGLPKPVTLYRVKSWMRQARNRTIELALIRGCR